MSVYSKFDDISLPAPPVFVTGDTLRYISTDLPQFLDSQYLALLDFISAVQSEFLISNSQIVDVSADKVANNTQFLNTVFVGAESKIKLDGPNNLISVDDNQGTPITRVKIGKLGSSATNEYGIQVIDAAGTVKFQTGTSTFLDGGIISADTITATQIDANTITASEIAADTITATQIAAGTITATELDAGAVTAAKINVTELSAIVADLGTITAGTITGGLIQTAASGARVELATTGLNAYKADGTQTVDVNTDGTFRFGPSGGNNIAWDNSTITVTGNIIATGNIEDGAVTSPVENTTTFNAEQSSGSANIVYTNNIDVTTKGGNVILIGSISGSTDDDDGQGQYTTTLRIKKGSTTLGEVSAISTGSFETIQVVAFDGSPSGSISSSATTTYNLELTTKSYDGTADAKGGFGNPATLKLITLETLK
tara:strand:- start:11663 stop:12949 length:1287 start_codon:yes stop_codon:yes gene_type:complete